MEMILVKRNLWQSPFWIALYESFFTLNSIKGDNNLEQSTKSKSFMRYYAGGMRIRIWTAVPLLNFLFFFFNSAFLKSFLPPLKAKQLQMAKVKQKQTLGELWFSYWNWKKDWIKCRPRKIKEKQKNVVFSWPLMVYKNHLCNHFSFSWLELRGTD